jgi:hypothetical protein
MRGGPTHPRVLHGASLFGNVQCKTWWSTNAKGEDEARKQGKSRDKGQARTRRNKAVCTYASTLHMPLQWRHPRCGQRPESCTSSQNAWSKTHQRLSELGSDHSCAAYGTTRFAANAGTCLGRTQGPYYMAGLRQSSGCASFRTKVGSLLGNRAGYRDRG